MRNDAHRSSHTLSSSARKKKKKNALKTSTDSARMKKRLPCTPFLTSLVTSAFASSTSARNSVETWAVASRTRVPIEAVSGLWGSVSGIEEIVVGTPSPIARLPFPVTPLPLVTLTSRPLQVALTRG